MGKLGAAIGFAVGGPAGAAVGSQIGNNKSSGGSGLKDIANNLGYGGGGADVPEVDPRLKEIATEQRKQAEAFKANLPNYKKSQYNLQAVDAKRDFANQLADIRQKANSRGLLYSGLRAGGEAESRGQLAGNLAGIKSNVNQSAEDQARELELQALNSAQGNVNLQNNREDILYNQALANKQAKLSALTDAAGVAGKLIGAAI